jgi:hypothetical protein
MNIFKRREGFGMTPSGICTGKMISNTRRQIQKLIINDENTRN